MNIDQPHEESPAPAEWPIDECDRQIRRMRIKEVMLQKYGHTEVCDGCRYKRAGMREERLYTEVCRGRIGEADFRNKEEDDERVIRRLAEKMEIFKEKQETEETIEKEPEEVKQEAEEDCRVARGMEQQEEGPERKRVQVSVEDALAQWCPRRSAGGEKRGLHETKEVQGENKRPRENAPRGRVGGVAHGLFCDPAVPARVDVAELYSPPRVTAGAQKFGGRAQADDGGGCRRDRCESVHVRTQDLGHGREVMGVSDEEDQVDVEQSGGLV